VGVDARDTSLVFDISGLVAGTNFWVRFRTIQPGWDWWWAVDNVCLDGIIPVELVSFAAIVNEQNVNLSWATATELNNQGFEVERGVNGNYEAVGYVQGNGTTTETQFYSFTDQNVNVGQYTYRLKQIDFDGTSTYSDGIEVDVTVPDVFALEQNYPNPFNPSTKINFSLAVDSKVSLKVFDVLGQEVVTLLSSDLVAGAHNVDFNASSLNSGVYFYRIEATGIDGTNFTNVKKMILTK
ncbi:MAG: T9SS type A sorting domain-containing protein, partial [Ignavibacteria bacterium]|nr:T9SS type A sorting domain-containing protein [Ignavibacteria bacterium]